MYVKSHYLAPEITNIIKSQKIIYLIQNLKFLQSFFVVIFDMCNSLTQKDCSHQRFLYKTFLYLYLYESCFLKSTYSQTLE